MSEKSQNVAIGAFIVGALLIAITTVLFIIGSGFGQREKIVMVFDGSVKGLNIGAPVALRGVQVGQVTDIDVILDSDTLDIIMVVEADFIDDSIKRVGNSDEDLTDELIKQGLRAQLNTQSVLTGLLYIQLDFHPGTKLTLRDIDSPYPQFPTIPTELEKIAKKIQELDIDRIADNAQEALAGLNNFLNNQALQNLPVDLQKMLASMTALSDQLQSQLGSSVPKVDRILDGATETIDGINAQLPALSDQVKLDLATLNDAVQSFEKAMSDIDSLVAPDSATTYRLNEALREITLASRAMQLLAKTLNEQPEALIRGRSGSD